MAWAKIDDKFWHHKKVMRAWQRDPAAIGLWTMALTQANETESDGWIDPEWLEVIMPDAERRERLATVLVDAGLWTEFGEPGNGWEFHDYHDFQPSKSHQEHVREMRRINGSKGGKRSGEVRAARSNEANAKQT